MKIKNNILLFLFASLSISFAACSEEDNEKQPPITNGKEIPELSLKENAIVLKVGSQEIIDITQGGGEYKAFTLNENVASVELVDGKLTVSGHGNGKTDLIISDSNNQYRKLAVTVYTYDELKLSASNIDISIKLGSLPQPVDVKVVQGNSLYSAKSENEDIATVSVQEETIRISFTGKEGSTTITVKDFMGLTITIPVQVSISTNPFTEGDLNKIMGSTTLRYSLSNGETINNLRQTYFNYLNSTTNNKQFFGYEFIDSVYDEALNEYVDKATIWLYITFDGDRMLGIKQNGKISYKSSEYSDEFTDQPANIEIIKNEKGKIWGIFYFVNQGTIFYGHFCQNAVPQ